MNKKQIEAIYSLSPQQQGMLFEHLVATESQISGVHVEQFTCTLRGDLDLTIFERAWRRLLERHSVLRTTFVWKDQPEPLQVVLRQAEPPLEQQDWRGLHPDEQRARLHAFLNQDHRRGFELGNAPLMRVSVFRLDERAYQLVWTFHHIILDGWSQPLILDELFALYHAWSQGREPALKPARPYRDYIAWLKQQDMAQTRAFWEQQLAGFVATTPLGTPTDPAAFPDDQQRRYGYEERRLPAPATSALQALAQSRRVTLSTLMQGVWALVLHAYSSHDDLVFGTTVSGRPPALLGVEAMVGQFISSLPLRARIDPQAVLWPWLSGIQSLHLKLQEYGYCSAGQIHQWSELPGSLPLYDSLLVFENYPSSTTAPGASSITVELGTAPFLGAQTNHPITLLATAGSDLLLQLVYDRHRLHPDDAPRVLEHCLALLQQIVARPDQPIGALLAHIPAGQAPRVRAQGPAAQSEADAPYVAPRNSTEQTLADLWSAAIGVERIGIHDNFFALGGYSLIAAEVMGRIRSAFQVELPLRHLFEAPTIGEMALLIAQRQAEQADALELERLLAELEGLSPEDASLALAGKEQA